MALDQLPGEIIVPTRDDIIEKHKRSFRLRVPNADTGDNTQPDIDARVAADSLLPIYALAKVIGNNAVLENARGKAVDQWGAREGVSPRREAVGASGYVQISASSGGGTIKAGDELVHEDSAFIFRAIETRHYDDGDSVAIVGKSTGPGTNLAAGVQLKWVSNRPGIGTSVTIVEQSDGLGLSGGHDKETDDEYVDRIEDEKQNRAASGNDAEYQSAAQNTPGVSVQKAFTYPGLTGPGSQSVVFTIPPARSGGSRVPNAALISLVEAFVVSEFPADDGCTFPLLVEEDAEIVYGITWAEEATGWEDIAPWPPYYERDPDTGPGAVVVSAATSSTSFTLAAANADYTGIQQPVIGQTIAFYDSGEFEFVRKRILSFTGTGPWVITVDTSNSVSDTGYTPEVDQRAMPWSDSLDAVLPGVYGYFDTLGPGEQVSVFYDEGRRQKRQPRPPKDWPYELTTRDLIRAITAEEVSDVDALEGDGLLPSVGTPGTLVNILKLQFISIFPGQS